MDGKKVHFYRYFFRQVFLEVRDEERKDEEDKATALAAVEKVAKKYKKAMWDAVRKSKFYGAFVLNHRVVLHAIDATPCSMAWRCRFLAARPSQVGHVIAEK